MGLARLTDVQLLERVRDHRDDDAFELLYSRHSLRCMSRAARLVFDPGLAADAVQAAFLDVWRGSASYSPQRGPVGPWITGITANRAVDILRRARTQERSGDAMTAATHVAPQAREPAEVTVEREQREILRASIDGLPPAQREVIHLAFYDGLSHSEIASRLSVPLGTVKGRVRSGLGRLRHQVVGDPASFA